ncbi:hypothetical protein Lser_V15G15986 [Lactuca serriola]
MYINLGDIIQSKVPSVKHIMQNDDTENKKFSIKSFVALSTSMALLQSISFKKNHGEWVTPVKPKLGARISERVFDVLKTSEQDIDPFDSIKTQVKEALSSLLGENEVTVFPTVPGPPPKLQTKTTSLETFRARAFYLLSKAGVRGVERVIFLGFR